MKRTIIFAAGIALAACSGNKTAEKEHAGEAAGAEHTEHAEGAEHADHAEGAEHAGKEHAEGAEHKDHAATEHAGDEAHVFTAKEIKVAMNAHIKAQMEAGKGDFLITDKMKAKDLTLEFVKIHDPVRIIEGKGYFACTDFHPKGAAADKLYDLDFWLNVNEGKLKVTDTKIHKHPKKEGGKWTKKARYTFKDDKPVEVK